MLSMYIVVNSMCEINTKYTIMYMEYINTHFETFFAELQIKSNHSIGCQWL